MPAGWPRRREFSAASVREVTWRRLQRWPQGLKTREMIVTVMCSFGERYLSTPLFEEE